MKLKKGLNRPFFLWSDRDMRFQKGSALIYILIAIALLGALTMAFVEPSSQQSRSQNSYKLAQELKSQAEAYRAAIQDCVISYPAGDTSSATKYTGYNEPYPLTPSDSYLPPAMRDANNKASAIRCPGNPGDSINHSAIFGGSTGRFAPVNSALFDGWIYVNDANGVYLINGTNKTDAYLWEAAQKAAATYSSCEAQALDGTGLCPSGYKCLLVWIIRKTACP